ncbi:hypothetical protein CDEF62S_02404 [Castellaniella defragrans]
MRYLFIAWHQAVRSPGERCRTLEVLRTILGAWAAMSVLLLAGCASLPKDVQRPAAIAGEIARPAHAG